MTYDLAYYDREIIKRELNILELQGVIADYNTTINMCKAEKEGFFSSYSCRRNTGMTIDEWRAARTIAEKDLDVFKKQLNTLRSQRAEAEKSIESSLQIRTTQAEVDIKEALASGELVKKYGKWVLLAFGVLTFGYFATKKLKS